MWGVRVGGVGKVCSTKAPGLGIGIDTCPNSTSDNAVATAKPTPEIRWGLTTAKACSCTANHGCFKLSRKGSSIPSNHFLCVDRVSAETLIITRVHVSYSCIVRTPERTGIRLFIHGCPQFFFRLWQQIDTSSIAICGREKSRLTHPPDFNSSSKMLLQYRYCNMRTTGFAKFRAIHVLLSMLTNPYEYTCTRAGTGILECNTGILEC